MTGRSLVVVVAHPDPMRAAAFAGALEQRGHTALPCSDPLEVLLTPRPDVLVVALDLSGGGLALLERLSQRGVAPTSVVLAHAPTPDVFREAMRQGARDLVTLPVAPSELARLVEVAGRANDAGVEMLRTYDATPASVDRGARDLAAWLLRRRVAPATRCRVATAVAEAIDNAAKHAYDGDIGPVEVVARLEGRELAVIVRDHGVGFDTAEVGLEHLDEPERGGLARMCALSEDLSFDGHDGGTRVSMRFSVYQAVFSDERCEDLSDLDFLTPTLARAVLSNLGTDGGGEPLHLSPALAVSVGRLLAGPDPRRVLETTLWS